MRRDATAGRRLVEIAVLERGTDGCVRAATVWHSDDGFGAGAPVLDKVIADRSGR